MKTTTYSHQNPLYLAAITLALCLVAQFQTLLAAQPPLPTDLQLISSNALPAHGGTWYSIQRWGKCPPLPLNWLAGRDDVQYYTSATLGTNHFVIDDTAVDYVEYYAEAQALAELTAAITGIPVRGPSPMWPISYGPSDLYLSIQTDTNTANFVDRGGLDSNFPTPHNPLECHKRGI
jgi:hypothetical protein